MNRALISVYHKEGIEEAASLLAAAGWEILSTGGTAAHLRERGIAPTDVAAVTGFPEILDGRVKTLHPHVFGPILARDDARHREQLAGIGQPPIALVMVNFYPFAETLRSGVREESALVEKIDIGGPSMVRAAAKNFQRVVVVVDPADYLPIARTLAAGGEIPLAERRRLARKAFSLTSYYDSLIADWLCGEEELPELRVIGGQRHQELRYGENPQQRAAFYATDAASPFAGLGTVSGKPLSFNNLLDAGMVYDLLQEYPAEQGTFAVIVKHQNPCGAARGATAAEAYRRAFAGDPQSAYGGIVGLNVPVDLEAATAIHEQFAEVVVAPDFSAEARALLTRKKNLRLLPLAMGYRGRFDLKTVPGGFLWQERDRAPFRVEDFLAKSERPLTAGELADVAFGWPLVKFVKSNAIVLVRDGQLIGVGAGQMSRVDSVELALRKCLTTPAGAVLLSDAFFPFADSLERAAAAGIRVVVEPGGSIRDPEVIEAARKSGLSLLFTGVRHFRH